MAAIDSRRRADRTFAYINLSHRGGTPLYVHRGTTGRRKQEEDDRPQEDEFHRVNLSLSLFAWVERRRQLSDIIDHAA